MKTIILDIDESIYKKLISLLETFPKEKIKIFDEINDSHIPFVSIEEQKVLEKILDNPDTKIIVKNKSIDL